MDPDGNLVHKYGAVFRIVVIKAAFRFCSVFKVIKKVYRTVIDKTGSKKKVRYREPFFYFILG